MASIPRVSTRSRSSASAYAPDREAAAASGRLGDPRALHQGGRGASARRHRPRGRDLPQAAARRRSPRRGGGRRLSREHAHRDAGGIGESCRSTVVHVLLELLGRDTSERPPPKWRGIPFGWPAAWHARQSPRSSRAPPFCRSQARRRCSLPSRRSFPAPPPTSSPCAASRSTTPCRSFPSFSPARPSASPASRRTGAGGGSSRSSCSRFRRSTAQATTFRRASPARRDLAAAVESLGEKPAAIQGTLYPHAGYSAARRPLETSLIRPREAVVLAPATDAYPLTKAELASLEARLTADQRYRRTESPNGIVVFLPSVP